MKKKEQLTSAICAVTLLAGVFAYGRGHFQTLQPRSAEFKQQDIYDHMFQDYAALKKKADEVERAGKNGQGLRTYYKRQAKLTEREADQIDKIAADVTRDLAKIDDKVKRIVDEVRARVPGGRLKRGEKAPPVPPELTALQQEREQIVLGARERLRTEFGDEAFARFDEFVQREIAGGMRTVGPLDGPHRPNPRGRPRSSSASNERTITP